MVQACHHADERHQLAVDVKTIGSSGQISLGKQQAGRTVTVEQVEEGVWVIKAARVISENELWLHAPEADVRKPATRRVDIHTLHGHPERIA